jgi:hypothetical protein
MYNIVCLEGQPLRTRSEQKCPFKHNMLQHHLYNVNMKPNLQEGMKFKTKSPKIVSCYGQYQSSFLNEKLSVKTSLFSQNFKYIDFSWLTIYGNLR